MAKRLTLNSDYPLFEVACNFAISRDISILPGLHSGEIGEVVSPNRFYKEVRRRNIKPNTDENFLKVHERAFEVNHNGLIIFYDGIFYGREMAHRSPGRSGFSGAREGLVISDKERVLSIHSCNGESLNHSTEEGMTQEFSHDYTLIDIHDKRLNSGDHAVKASEFAPTFIRGMARSTLGMHGYGNISSRVHYQGIATFLEAFYRE